MTNKKIWLVMLALLVTLALGLTVVGCVEPTDDNTSTESVSDSDTDTEE
jgi:hypothetical protein